MTPEPESAEVAYDRFAPIYDEWNAQNDYEMWLGEVLLPELGRHGLAEPAWALDVGCGTGRAFEPLLNRGWKVIGCDASSGMLAEAERKFGSRVPLRHIDARSLPAIQPGPDLPAEGAFELILMLNDVVNYLVEDGDLEQAFAGVRRNLSDSGRVVFDANTIGLFRDDFTAAMKERGWEWQGMVEEVAPGGIVEGRLSGRDIETHVHRQRHWPPAQVTAAMETAGLHCLAALGQREEGGSAVLSDPPDEERDAKVIYIAALLP